MYRLQLGLAVAAAVSTGGWWSPSWDAVDIQAVQGTAAEPASSPPAAWLPADPADSLYKAARDALNRREYRTAADLFAQVPARYPKSGYAGDALYWQAFALYRVGREPELRTALDALRRQRERYAGAATKGDAAALEQRIQGVLARELWRPERPSGNSEPSRWKRRSHPSRPKLRSRRKLPSRRNRRTMRATCRATTRTTAAPTTTTI